MTTARPDVFLSYSREDQAVARRFAEGFQREGLRVWWDQALRSGENYDQVTEKALREAKAVVVLWSRTSVESRWVRAEATTADRRGKLVPVMIEPCERPIMFELIQTAEIADWSGNRTVPAWQSLLADVRRHLGVVTSGDADRPSEVSRAAPRDELPSLALIPFTNRSGQSTDDVFADGMVEDLISALSLTSHLRVVAFSATVGYRGKGTDLRTIGRELGVRYLLEGNVRRAGDELRVTAQLVQAENGAILWTGRFERPLTELAALQEQLVFEVAAQLNVQLERVEIERALRKPDDLTAWEAVMRARSAFVQEVGVAASDRAVAEARRAVAIAPDYALAHAQLAVALRNRLGATASSDPAMSKEARDHVDRALALDSTAADVLGLCSAVLGFFGDWDLARSCARRALEVNPNQAFAHNAEGLACLHEESYDDALAHFRAAERAAPRGLMSFLTFSLQGLAHFGAGRYEEALQALDNALLRNPLFPYALKDRPVLLARLGRLDEAREAVRKLRQTYPAMTLETIELQNSRAWLPRIAEEMNATLRSIW
jgi:TolB-like protein